MLSFAVYNMPLVQYEELNQLFCEQKISPLQYQAELGRTLIVSGFDVLIAEYIVGLNHDGKVDTVSAKPNAWTTHLGIKAGLLSDILEERVKYVETNLLRDIRKVNKLALAALKHQAEQELAVVLVEEN